MDYFAIDNPKSLPRLLYRIAKLQTNSINRILKKMNITMDQLTLLAELYRQDGMSLKVLAAKTCKDHTNIARILKPFVAEGLVEIMSPPEDRRYKLVYLTKAGREYMSELERYLGKCSEFAYNHYDKSTLDLMMRSMQMYEAIIVNNCYEIEQFAIKME